MAQRNIDAFDGKLVNLADGTDVQDGVTKAQLDAIGDAAILVAAAAAQAGIPNAVLIRALQNAVDFIRIGPAGNSAATAITLKNVPAAAAADGLGVSLETYLKGAGGVATLAGALSFLWEDIAGGAGNERAELALVLQGDDGAANTRLVLGLFGLHLLSGDLTMEIIREEVPSAGHFRIGNRWAAGGFYFMAGGIDVWEFDAVSGNLRAINGLREIEGLDAPTAGSNAANKDYVDAADAATQAWTEANFRPLAMLAVASDITASSGAGSDAVSSSDVGAIDQSFTHTATVPANRLKVGSVVRLTAWGQVTEGTVVGLRFTPRLGTVTMGGQSSTNIPETSDWFRVEVEAVFTAIGAGGRFNSTAKVFNGRSDAGTYSIDWKAALQSALDTTGAAVLDLQVNWEVDGGNTGTVALYGMTVEVIN